MAPDDFTPEAIQLATERSRRSLMHWIMGILAGTVVLSFASVFWFIDQPSEGAIAAIFTPIVGLAGGATGFYFAERAGDEEPTAR